MPLKTFLAMLVKKEKLRLLDRGISKQLVNFLAFIKNIGFIVVRGDEDEYFVNYGYNENKSKLLCFFYKHRIPNSLSGTTFTHHRAMLESGEYDTEFSKLYFFLSSITNRCEEINQHMKCVT